ncbi:hypothetical protein NLU13_5654 [Sarocladium strictum]|uniref:Uncharacterized protein n=1 Tax=Sarocladium strictum TaxID=5046 RepID=A0AA39GHW8_SARSR|nr:hypothetical protein NLU13_5654 [Sarocladium strictum]
MDPTNGGLMAINLSDSEDETIKTDAHPRAKKTAQSEEAFQAVKAEYKTKVENGEVYKHIRPIVEGTNKQHVQEVVHAVEELYYFRRFQEAADLAERVLRESTALDDHGEVRQLLESYEKRCRSKAASQP